jgi:hypothetical protein
MDQLMGKDSSRPEAFGQGNRCSPQNTIRFCGSPYTRVVSPLKTPKTAKPVLEVTVKP